MRREYTIAKRRAVLTVRRLLWVCRRVYPKQGRGCQIENRTRAAEGGSFGAAIGSGEIGVAGLRIEVVWGGRTPRYRWRVGIRGRSWRGERDVEWAPRNRANDRGVFICHGEAVFLSKSELKDENSRFAIFVEDGWKGVRGERRLIWRSEDHTRRDAGFKDVCVYLGRAIMSRDAGSTGDL